MSEQLQVPENTSYPRCLRADMLKIGCRFIKR